MDTCSTFATARLNLEGHFGQMAFVLTWSSHENFLEKAALSVRNTIGLLRQEKTSGDGDQNDTGM